MNGVELDFIVKDTLKALETYQTIFDLEVIEATSFPTGSNEVVFTLYGTRFHMLDENLEFGMLAPTEGQNLPIWFNVVVPNIQTVWDKAMAAGCKEIMPLTRMDEMGITHAMFLDHDGYTWMLHEIHHEVSFEERVDILADKMDLNSSTASDTE